MKYSNHSHTLIVLLLIVFCSGLVEAQNSQGFIVTSPPSLSTILHPGQSASQTQWIVTVSLNGGGQSLAGTLTNSSINYQGFTSVYPLQISATTNPEQAFYIINNGQPLPIYSYSYFTEYGRIIPGLYVNVTSAPSCPSNYASGTYYSEWDTSFSAYSLGAWYGSKQVATPIRICIYQKPVGYESGISQVNQLFSSVFTISANGHMESLTLSSNNQSATSSDGEVQVNWDGSLITGTGVPEASQYVAVSNDQQSQNWIAVTEASYSNYQGQYSSISSQLSSKTFSPTQSTNTYPSPCSAIVASVNSSYLTNVGNCLMNSSLQSIVSQNNGAVATLEQGTQIGGYATQTTTYQGQSAFLVTLPSQFVTTNPQVTLRISGDFIGVVIPEGTPRILTISSQPFNSGNVGKISVTIKNIGNAQGSFYTSLSNCTGVQPTTVSPDYAFQSGQTENLSIDVSTTGANSNLNEECTVTVTDANGGGSSSSPVDVIMKQANQCTPNTQIIQGSTICVCTNVNGVYQPTSCTACPNGVTNSNGQYACAQAPAGTNSTSGVNINLNSTNVNGLINSPIVQQVVAPMVKGVVCSSPTQSLVTTGLVGIFGSTGIGSFLGVAAAGAAKLMFNQYC
jgi:hypothetical protein